MRKALVCVVVFTLAGVAGSGAGENVENGAEIANRDCARCHVVSEERRFSGISSTPSFMMMVNFLADWEERFQTFYARPPHPVHVRIEGIEPLTSLPSNATVIELTLDDVDDLLEYARSLQTE